MRSESPVRQPSLDHYRRSVDIERRPNRHGFAQPATLVAAVLIASCILIWYLFAPPGLTAEHALNATYDSEWTASGSVALRDGAFTGNPEAEGLEARLNVELWGFALGNIDDQGGNDAASVLVSTVGSRRQYYELHVLVERDGKAVNAGSAFLGDRIRIDCLIVHGPGMTLRWLTSTGELVSRDFQIRNGRLIELDL